jgi:hypothetical protein
MPVNWKRGERENLYLRRLLANRPMPMEKDSELALAITYAKDHWWNFAVWPEDEKRYAEYERERRRKKENEGASVGK